MAPTFLPETEREGIGGGKHEKINFVTTQPSDNGDVSGDKSEDAIPSRWNVRYLFISDNRNNQPTIVSTKRPKIVNSFDEIDKGLVASANGNAGTVEFDFASNV